MICVGIGRTRHKMVILEHRALAERGAQLVELRLDWLSRIPDLGRLIDKRPTPVIITCRRPEDQGQWTGTEEQRVTLLRSAIVAGVEYVDLEEDIAGDIPRYGDTRRIISYHNFDETPDDLEDIHAKLCDRDPDIVKIVTMANSTADMVRMLQLVEKSDVPTAGFCMGEFGMPSRVLCGKFGSPLTYTTFSSDRQLAPGQISFEEMRDLYRYDSITKDTPVFAVVGDPIAHSMSPLLHNRAFEAAGVDGVYIPLRIPAGTLQESLQALEPLKIGGVSVTIPHKEAAKELAVDPDETVQAVGAANTLVRNDEDQWRAFNTDYDAIEQSVRVGLNPDDPENVDLTGRTVLLLGAGGAARAAASAMVRAGAVVTISSRTHKRAVELAEEVDAQSVTWENRGASEPDILINCTPVGMHPNVDESPYEEHWLHEDQLVFDTVYNPEQTLLIKNARERGSRTVTGIEMFVRQAARQFELYTGQPGPLEQMRETMRDAISPV